VDVSDVVGLPEPHEDDLVLSALERWREYVRITLDCNPPHCELVQTNRVLYARLNAEINRHRDMAW
jgi:hypothetical protein